MVGGKALVMMDSVKASIARPVYERIMAARRALIEQRGYNLSVSQVIEIMLDRAAEHEEQGS